MIFVKNGHRNSDSVMRHDQKRPPLIAPDLVPRLSHCEIHKNKPDSR